MEPHSMRTEQDSLGSIDVPRDALYGAQTQRAIQNFEISGLVLQQPFLHALGLIKYAAAKANGSVGLLPARFTQAIAEASLDVASGKHDRHFPVDVFQTGSGTSTNMNANEVIARLASCALNERVHPNDHVNMGQSSNDVIPSALHLAAVLQTESKLLPALHQLKQGIAKKALFVGKTVKTGRTHLMDAMPITFAQELSGWEQQITNSIERVQSTLPRLKRLSLGGTAVGTGINAHPEFGVRATQFLSARCKTDLTVSPNHFESLSCQETALELSSHLKTLATGLIKIANDLRWMNSGPLAGLAEIKLPELQPGSSIMPGKVNPVIPEAVAMASAQVIGNDATITVAAQSGNFQLNVMLPVIAYNLLQSIELMANSATTIESKAIAGFAVNSDRIESTLAANPMLVTALNGIIGYEKSAEIAKQTYEQQRPILEIAAELSGIDEKDLAKRLNPVTLTDNQHKP